MYSQNRFKLTCSVYFVPVRDGRVLLARRCNTGYEDGKYGLVAGHLDGNESVTAGIIREAKEESGITLFPEQLRVVHTMHRRSDDERIDIFFTADTWEGDPIIAEPDKCDHMDWFPIDNLPVNTIPYIRFAINNIHNDQQFSEFGWND